MPPSVMPAADATFALPGIESDRPAATAALLALAHCALKAGARVQAGTLFRIAGGDLSVHRTGHGTRAALMTVPAACLPNAAAESDSEDVYLWLKKKASGSKPK